MLSGKRTGRYSSYHEGSPDGLLAEAALFNDAVRETCDKKRSVLFVCPH
jgi:hypothetical protein